jgi:hypothetical protein
MKRVRAALLVLSLVGLGASTWLARPADFSDLGGWAFASMWSSLAWIVLCWVSVRWGSAATALGGLVAVILIEFSLFAFSPDPLMLAVKPVWELIALLTGAFIPAAARRLCALDA